MRFPTINDVAADLRQINKTTLQPDDADEGIDVRLQVYPDGEWAVHSGSADYDQDHRGYWGSSSVPGDNRRFDSKDIARDLIEQAREHKATGGDDDDVSESPARGRVASSSKQNQDAKHFRKYLEEGVLLVGGEVVDNNSIDVDDDSPVFVSIVVNVTGYGPHVGAISATQSRHGHPDTALEAAHEILEEWENDHYEEVSTETYDGQSWKLSAEDFADAIDGTAAAKYFDIDASDPLGSEDEEEDLEEEDEDE